MSIAVLTYNSGVRKVWSLDDWSPRSLVTQRDFALAKMMVMDMLDVADHDITKVEITLSSMDNDDLITL